MSSEMQKVGDVRFRIVDSNMDIGFVWKEGSLYLTLHNVMITDGDVWYEIPIKSLEDIESDGEGVSFRVESMTLTIKGGNADRLMAVRHLLLPLIEGAPPGKDLTESVIKLMLIGIKDEDVMSSVMKRDISEVRETIERAEKEGLISGGMVTEKGKALLSPEERELLEEAEETREG